MSISVISQLKYQNLSPAALDVIFHALILSDITYALPVVLAIYLVLFIKIKLINSSARLLFIDHSPLNSLTSTLLYRNLTINSLNY